MDYIQKLLKLFTKKERRQLGILTGAILFMALMEVIGVGAIGPFMTVAADPSVVQETPVLLWLYQSLGIQDMRYFIAALGVAFFLIILGTNGFTTIVMFFLFRWSNMRSYTLGRRLMSQYLYQPYSYFLDHNTSELSKNILAEVQQILTQAIRPGMELLARGMVALAILLFLILSSPLVALVVAVVLGGSYAIVFGLVRSKLTKIGTKIRKYNRERFKTAGEAFGAIKDVKILGKEPVFEAQYAGASRRFARQQANRQIITSLPHHIIEAVALGLVVLLVVVLIITGGRFAEVIPLVSIYAFAGYRLMPALRIVFKNAGALRSSGPIVQAFYEDLTTGAAEVEASRKAALHLAATGNRLAFNERIELRNIEFMYPASPAPVLSGISLSIKKNSTIGFIGPTGCGKTTLVDIILGLLKPEGSIEVDGVPVTDENIRNWQLNFGYVPQQIFLADDTVTRNIAFGVDTEKIDQAAVEKAARIAHLDDFVRDEMPQGYETLVGERGVRLSGGQRQRVGIARALYHDPDILVLDEATSALDNLTEQAVMDAIDELMGAKTIIMIAHRLSTVQKADIIYMLDKGRIAAEGSYDQLMESSEAFRKMARIND
ncbi:ABC transporter ATP-binding protein/permease [Marispirochaeta aestuarii]|uniref:ABC transporter ATP-binding protein n=1 Tax=Marispirochaeta aestuarii TaxID=1963862 RepID=UPI0029C695DD|nr:ABC transporter ATP-binding protein/permease [Marispirochaeta aestuarii]